MTDDVGTPGEASPPPSGAVPETLAEKLGTAPGPTTPATAPPDKAPSMVLQFVVFPLAIVILAVAITGFFQWLSQDNRTYDDYLNEIVSGWKQKQPEAAYQLVFRLADQQDDLRKHANVPRTITVFEAAKKADDPRVRRWLSIVLGHLGAEGHIEVVPPLLDATSSAEPDQETRLNATWSLGRCHDGEAAAALTGLLDDPFEGERKTAAFALGELGEETGSGGVAMRAVERKAACDALARHLSDPVVDVQWNCANALARMGDDRAVPTLLAMLDRKYLSTIQGPRDADHLPMTDRQREDVMVNALIAVRLLHAKQALEKVSAVADGDPSLKVRDAAMRVRDELRK